MGSTILIFVGISRAVSWVYLSSVEGKLIDVITELCLNENKDYLEIQRKNNVNNIVNDTVVDVNEDWLDDIF